MRDDVASPGKGPESRHFPDKATAGRRILRRLGVSWTPPEIVAVALLVSPVLYVVATY
jgi:hypothetical protein